MTPLSIDDLVAQMSDLGASDLHLTPSSRPMVRRRGELEPLTDREVLTPEMSQQLIYHILSTEQQKILETRRNIDMAYSVPGVGRLRVNVFFQRSALSAALQHDPDRHQVARRARPAPAHRGARDDASRARARHRAHRLG